MVQNGIVAQGGATSAADVDEDEDEDDEVDGYDDVDLDGVDQ